eukprot:jgi/Chrzof1/7973/UNPLg00896.t1
MFSLADMLEQNAGSRAMSFHSQGSYLRVCTFSQHGSNGVWPPAEGAIPCGGGPWGVYAALFFLFMKKRYGLFCLQAMLTFHSTPNLALSTRRFVEWSTDVLW